MDRKKLLFGLGAASAGAAAVTSSGAFSSTDAQRDVSVTVEGDGAAYLALDPATGPNSAYVDTAGDRQLVVELSAENDAVDGDGVNPNAQTTIGTVFRLTNQGTQAVDVVVQHESSAVTFTTGSVRLDDPEAPVTFQPGESRAVELRVDSRGVEDEQLLEAVTIRATADDGSGGEQPGTGPTATRQIEPATLSPGESVGVTLDVELTQTADVDIFERVAPGLGAATFESAMVGSTSVTPGFADFDTGGGVAVFTDVDPGTLSVRYTLTVAADAPAGEFGFEPNLVDIGDQTVPVEGVDTVEVVQ